jgi:RNA-directed DNA polymerase
VVTVSKAYGAIDNYTAVWVGRWLRLKHKVMRPKGGTYPLSHLYGQSGHDVINPSYAGNWVMTE